MWILLKLSKKLAVPESFVILISFSFPLLSFVFFSWVFFCLMTIPSSFNGFVFRVVNVLLFPESGNVTHINSMTLTVMYLFKQWKYDNLVREAFYFSRVTLLGRKYIHDRRSGMMYYALAICFNYFRLIRFLLNKPIRRTKRRVSKRDRPFFLRNPFSSHEDITGSPWLRAIFPVCFVFLFADDLRLSGCDIGV